MRSFPSWSSHRYTLSVTKTVIPAGIAGIQATWMYLSSPSLTTTLRTGHGTGYPLPGGYDELPMIWCITMRAGAWEPAKQFFI